MIIFEPIGETDLILFSADRESTIRFAFLEIEAGKYPAISFRVHVKERLFSGEVKVWIEKRKFDQFFLDMQELNRSRTGKSTLEAMSPRELELTLYSDRVDRFSVDYSIMQIKYSNNRSVETVLKGTFEFDSEFINRLEQDVKSISDLFHKGTN